MTIKYANDAKSTLASALTSSATSLSVANAGSFPTINVGDEMYLTLADPLNSVSEIVKCTAVSGTTFTVVRGHESTTAVSWTAGSHVQLRITAGLVENLLAEKIDDAQVLTNVPSGAVFTDTVYTHPANHAISVVTGLQTALDGKVDDAQVLTNVPSGAVFTDTVYTHPANHAISVVTGLQAALDTKATTTSVNNLTTVYDPIGASVAMAIALGG